MNFQDLLSKMKQIDETVSVEECGMPMPGISVGGPRPEQADSVTMNVSMNGSGAGGIKDLMNILKNIEHGSDDVGGHHDSHRGDDEIVIGGPLDAKMADLEDSYNNEPNPVTTGSNMMTGDDLASKGGEAEKVNGGGNPMNVDEGLVSRLQAHYESIKGAPIEEGMWDTIKQGAQSAVQGAQQLGQQAVQGVKNVANTVANTSVGDAAKAVGQAGLAQAKALANPGAAIGGVLQQAGDAVTNARNSLAQKAGNAVGQAASAVGQKVANAVAPAAGGFDTMPDNMTVANPTGAAPTATAPQLNQKVQTVAQQMQPGMSNAFESVEMTDIKKLAGL